MKQNIEIFNEVRMTFAGQPLTGKDVKSALSEIPCAISVAQATPATPM